jgi:hypothetical protein
LISKAAGRGKEYYTKEKYISEFLVRMKKNSAECRAHNVAFAKNSPTNCIVRRHSSANLRCSEHVPEYASQGIDSEAI